MHHAAGARPRRPSPSSRIRELERRSAQKIASIESQIAEIMQMLRQGARAQGGEGPMESRAEAGVAVETGIGERTATNGKQQSGRTKQERGSSFYAGSKASKNWRRMSSTELDEYEYVGDDWEETWRIAEDAWTSNVTTERELHRLIAKDSKVVQFCNGSELQNFKDLAESHAGRVHLTCIKQGDDEKLLDVGGKEVECKAAMVTGKLKG